MHPAILLAHSPAPEGAAAFYFDCDDRHSLGVCERAIRRLISSGKLKTHRIGGRSASQKKMQRRSQSRASSLSRIYKQYKVKSLKLYHVVK
jgi:hypothetical protein